MKYSWQGIKRLKQREDLKRNVLFIRIAEEPTLSTSTLFLISWVFMGRYLKPCT